MSIKNQNVLILVKQPRSLVAQDPCAIETLERVPNGQQVKVNFSVPRNIKHWRLFHAIINVVFEAQPEPKAFPTRDSLIDALKDATGYVRYYKDFSGNEHRIPDSLGFGRMDQVAFSEWFDAAITIILERVLPHCTRQDIESQVYNMLGELGPDALRNVS